MLSGSNLASALSPGKATAIVGRSGTGKTALALEAAGLRSPTREAAGSLEPADRASTGFVPTDPYLAFSGIKSTLNGDLLLSAQFAGLEPERALGEIRRIAEELCLTHLLGRDPFTLSGGEAMRAAIALATVKGPTRLVTDEIYGALAEDSVNLVRGLFARLRARGLRLVETHNDAPPWLADYDEVVPLGPASDASPPAVTRYSSTPSPVSVTVMTAERLAHTFADGQFALGPLDLELAGGEILALTGPNGAGKTTLLMGLAQLLPARFSRLELAGETFIGPKVTRRQRRRWPRSIGYVFQNPDDQIHCASVRAELLEMSRWLGQADRSKQLLEVSGAFGLHDRLDQAPTTLPRPMRRLIALGGALVAQPPILLLDEPTAGLDPFQVRAVDGLLQRYRHDGGAVAMVSHDKAFVHRHATRRVQLANGQVAPMRTD